MNPAFIEALFRVPEVEAQDSADALLDAGALSVSVEDADAESPDERPLYGEPGHEPESHAWRNSLLVALFEAGADAPKTIAAAIAYARERGVDLPLPQAVRGVDDRDWVRATQSQFEPQQIGRLWIVPSWHAVPKNAALAIRLDPGMAFGTGTHPTTRLCLAWLDKSLAPGEAVLDYGCGSGILAIAAKLLGASRVEGVDIDPNAIVAARDNALRNGVDAHFADVGTGVASGSYDVVVANILSNPLKLLAPALIARVRPNGALVLSGVLERQADEVAQVYGAHGLSLSVVQASEGWACLAGRARSAAP